MSVPAGGLRTASGGRIERTQRLRFTFDGRSYEGVAGDTLASALLANGVHLTGRSFKYHRPRGILAAGSEEPNALVTVSRDAARVTPNLRATQVELYDGLVAESQNRWPSLEVDFGRINDRLSAFFPAGFYYKTFMWPRKAWQWLYEPVIRRAAGLGPRARACGSGPLCTALCALRRTRGRRRSRRYCRRLGGCRGRRPSHRVRRNRRIGRQLAGGHECLDRRLERARVAAAEPRKARRQRSRHIARAHHRLRLFPAQSHRSDRNG